MNIDWRMAEALAIQKLHGPDAARWTAERIRLLARAGDAAGVERFNAIADRLDALLRAAEHPCLSTGGSRSGR